VESLGVQPKALGRWRRVRLPEICREHGCADADIAFARQLDVIEAAAV
jgi:hypothetical protein